MLTKKELRAFQRSLKGSFGWQTMKHQPKHNLIQIMHNLEKYVDDNYENVVGTDDEMFLRLNKLACLDFTKLRSQSRVLSLEEMVNVTLSNIQTKRYNDAGWFRRALNLFVYLRYDKQARLVLIEIYKILLESTNA